jgi:hypothetical protein
VGEIICLLLAALGFSTALRVHLKNRRWAKVCQESRIAIAYKRRIAMQAPLTDFIVWIDQLTKDEQSNGRVVYGRAGVTVAILAPPKRPKRRKARVPE